MLETRCADAQALDQELFAELVLFPLELVGDVISVT